jgi:hypothetical protein
MGKYSNVPTTVDGKTFHSKLEAERYQELRILAKAGKIRNLQCQVKFSLDVDGVHITNYIADFTYHTENGAFVVEDTKGVITDVYKLKERLMAACHGIKVERVYRSQVGTGKRVHRGRK